MFSFYSRAGTETPQSLGKIAMCRQTRKFLTSIALKIKTF